MEESKVPFLDDSDQESSSDFPRFETSSPSTLRKILRSLPLILSLFTNLILIVLLTTQKTTIIQDISKYAKLERNIPVPWNPYSEYGVGSKNNTERTILWESLDTTPGEVAIGHEEAEKWGLPPAQDWPWDTEKGIYLVNGFHQMHCLRKIHRWVTLAYHNGTQLDNYHHVVHCLDMIRQDIQCSADDTPLFSSPSERKDAGNNQDRMCRSWSKLTTWANSQSACYSMINETQGVSSNWERYKFCSPGEHGYERMKAYLNLPEDWEGRKPLGIESIPRYWEQFEEVEFEFDESNNN